MKDELIKFLMRKGVSLEKLLVLGLVYRFNGDKLSDFFQDGIMFPIFSSNGKFVVGFSGRSIGDFQVKNYDLKLNCKIFLNEKQIC
jgi:DNA primase